VAFKDGIFNFTDTFIKGPPGTKIILSIEFIGFSTDTATIEIFKDPSIFEINLRNCIDGEELTEDFKCQSCPTGTFL
jgi:hypothetical protein